MATKLQYGVIVWGSAAAYNIYKLQALQNKFIRSISGLDNYTSVSHLYDELKINTSLLIYIKKFINILS